MKLSTTLSLAGMLLAGSALAQSEQWLEYHTSSEARSYNGIQLTTNAPQGVTLPKLISPQPYFAYWKTPMDPSGGRWLCFDRTRKSGPYDLLYIDSNGNGRLDDEKPFPARLESYSAYFPTTPVVFKGEDGPITYHLLLRFYQYDRSPAQLLASSACWYEGVLNFDGVKKRVKLTDGNVNGTFNDMEGGAYSRDRVQVEGDKIDQRFLGKMLEVDGKFFQFEPARDGAFVKVKKMEDVALGPVRVPENISEFVAYGENGHFLRKPVNGELTLPKGNYQIYSWSINRKDDKGADWTLNGNNFPDSAKFDVSADKPAALEIGEPMKAVLSAREDGRQISFNLKLEGPMKESVDVLRGGQRAPAPKLMVSTADGTLLTTNSFEYG